MADKVAYLVPNTNNIVQVPTERLAEVEAAGYRPASKEQEIEYYAKKEQRAKSGLQQAAEGLGVGIAGGALGIPAAVASLTGIDKGATGHEYLAELINSSEIPPEEMVAKIRAIADAAPVSHFIGESASLAAGGGLAAKGVQALAKGAAKRTLAKGAATAGASEAAASANAANAATAAARVTKAGLTAEAVAANIVQAREEAFVANREVTAETIMIAAAFGGVGPLAVGPAMGAFASKAQALGKNAAGKIDDFRAARAAAARETAEATHTSSVLRQDLGYRKASKAARRAEEVVADVEGGTIPASFTKKYEAELRRAVAAEQRAAERLAKREAHLASLAPSDGIKATKVAERARDKAATDAADHAANVAQIRDSLAKRFGIKTAPDSPRVPTAEAGPGDLESLLRASVDATKKPAKVAIPDAIEAKAATRLERETAKLAKLEAKGSSKAAAARLAVDEARASFEAAKASAMAAREASEAALREAPDMARSAFSSAQEKLAAAEAAAREKAKSTFSWHEPKSAKFMDLFTPGKRLSGAAEGLEEAAESLERSRRAGVGLSYALEGRARNLLGGGLGASLAGGVVGAAAVAAQLGPMAAGLAVRQTANVFRAAARGAANVARKGGRNKMAIPIAIGRQAYRARYLAAIHAITDEIDATIHDPEAFASEIGAAYGELEEQGPGVVEAITRQHMSAISYLKGEAPSMPPLYPAMPQLGRREPSMTEMESYMRKVQAIADPLFIVDSLADGELHSDVVEAMDAVYPMQMLALRGEVLDSLSEATVPLTRKQAISVDKLFGSRGAVHRPNNPDYQARTGMRAEADAQAAAQAPRGAKPGRRTPTISQQMRPHSQRASDSIGH